MSRPSFRERLRYRGDQFFQSGFTLQIFYSSLIVVAVITAFYFIAEIAGIHPGPDFGVTSGDDPGPYWPSVRLWWVIMHMMESYWLETSTFSQVLSVFLTLFNFLVFAAIVGLVGSRIQQRLEQVRRGTSRVVEEGHIVILGWSGKVLPIFVELQAGMENRAKVFVLLTERPIDEIDARIRRQLRSRRTRPRWVIRQGSLTDLKDLELLAIERASEVIVLRPDGDEGKNDVQVVKTIMAAAHLIKQCGQHAGERPDIIAEIEDPSFVQLAHAAANGTNLSIIQPSDNLSKIILQTARQRGLVQVYDELLSHLGSELHFVDARPLAGGSWEEAMFRFPSALPIGVLRRGRPLLAPAGGVEGFTILPEDSIIAIARTQEDMRIAEPATPPLPTPPDDIGITARDPIRNMLLVGWNNKVPPLLHEYAAYARSAGRDFSATIVSPCLPEGLTADEILQEFHGGHELDIRMLKYDYLAPQLLEDLQPGTFDAVIVLSERSDDARFTDPDSRVIMTLLLLRSLREQAEKADRPFLPQQQIVGEILDIGNKELAEATGTLRDVIISNDLVSKMIAQVCRERRTGAVMADLFDEHGKEIYIRSALLYAATGSNVRFDQLALAAVKRGEAALGYFTGGGGAGERCMRLNPPRQEELRVEASLELIVVAEGEQG